MLSLPCKVTNKSYISEARTEFRSCCSSSLTPPLLSSPLPPPSLPLLTPVVLHPRCLPPSLLPIRPVLSSPSFCFTSFAFPPLILLSISSPCCAVLLLSSLYLCCTSSRAPLLLQLPLRALPCCRSSSS